MQTKVRGFTLIELMLVLAVMGAMIYMTIGYYQQKALQMRIDRSSLQMQQILNAGLAYYSANGKWPTALSDLQPASGTNYLPGLGNSPWGKAYSVGVLGANFAVYTVIPAISGSASVAQVIAGTLPLAYATSGTGTPPVYDSTKLCAGAASEVCTVVSTINTPGQDLNNASAFNFGGVYNHGGCVPVPNCPKDQNGKPLGEPEILVVPVSVSGFYDSTTSVYPITSFTAGAIGDGKSDPAACPIGTSPTCPTTPAGINYWRVCLQIVTQQGSPTAAATDWEKKVTLMAVTRCAITGEPSGTAYQPASLF